AWAWGSQSVAASSKRTAVAFARRTRPAAAPSSPSPCRSARALHRSTPSRRRRPHPRKSRSSMADEGHAPLILVIEDEVQMLRFLRPALQSHGFRLHEARTGLEGLREAATRAPGVWLLDLGL